MNTKHTPGPWMADADAEIIRSSVGHKPAVAFTNPEFYAEVRGANARLIAEAPAMVDALRKARHYIQRSNCDEAYTVGDSMAADRLLSELDSILARIEGEPHA